MKYAAYYKGLEDDAKLLMAFIIAQDEKEALKIAKSNVLVEEMGE